LEEQMALVLDTPLVQPWEPQRFELVKTLQHAPRNYGVVELMRDIECGGSFVAVKRIPVTWTCSGPEEFKQQHPNAVEKPWLDAAVASYLHSVNYAYLCEPRGVFQDLENTYIVSTYAAGGDLFSWIQNGPKPGHAREKMVRPVMAQVFEAVSRLHNIGIVHGDISLENIVLMNDELPQVKLIDFGAASLSSMSSGTCDKPPYVAPEMHASSNHDGFLSDIFALGVVLFSVAACCYPWNSTRPGNCKMFSYAYEHGLRPYLLARKTKGGNGEPLARTLSESLVLLLEGLVAMTPTDRVTLGKHTSCGETAETAASVLDSVWWTDSV
jgi:serine/threonine protein kinase